MKNLLERQLESQSEVTFRHLRPDNMNSARSNTSRLLSFLRISKMDERRPVIGESLRGGLSFNADRLKS